MFKFSTAGFGNLWHACHTRHVKQFPMARSCKWHHEVRTDNYYNAKNIYNCFNFKNILKYNDSSIGRPHFSIWRRRMGDWRRLVPHDQLLLGERAQEDSSSRAEVGNARATSGPWRVFVRPAKLTVVKNLHFLWFVLVVMLLSLQ